MQMALLTGVQRKTGQGRSHSSITNHSKKLLKELAFNSRSIESPQMTAIYSHSTESRAENIQIQPKRHRLYFSNMDYSPVQPHGSLTIQTWLQLSRWFVMASMCGLVIIEGLHLVENIPLSIQTKTTNFGNLAFRN